MAKRLSSRRFLMLCLLAGMLVIASGAVFAQEHHWSYEGDEGPEHWGDMSAEFAACANGTAQSPIDVSDAQQLNLVDIEINYGETALNIFNNGHTIQVNVDEGSSITYNEITYNLLQFHFHHPSEHSVDGERADMEIHFVHQDPASGSLAVVGILLMAGDADSAAYQAIFDYLPSEEGEPEAMGMAIDLNSLLPDQHTFYTYQGSLTTPPCSEIVRWLLMDTPITLGEMQVEAFGSIFEMNARPVQPLNDRDLFVDTGM